MGKKLITSLSKKRKRGEKEKGKEGKRKKEGKDGFWLTQENKQNLFWEKKKFPGGKNIIFSRCECF